MSYSYLVEWIWAVVGAYAFLISLVLYLAWKHLDRKWLSAMLLFYVLLGFWMAHKSRLDEQMIDYANEKIRNSAPYTNGASR